MDDNTPKVNLGAALPVEVVDPDRCPVVYGDVLTEFKVFNGMVYLSLGNIIQDGDAPTRTIIRVAARLRLAPEVVNTITRLMSVPNEEPAPDGMKLN